MIEIPDFKTRLTGATGVEVEVFTTASLHGGVVVAKSNDLLGCLVGDERFKSEFPACQVEMVTNPHRYASDLARELRQMVIRLHQASEHSGVGVRAIPVGKNVPLDHTDTERYNEIAASISDKQKRSAFSVAGVHVHFGCHDVQHQLKVFNRLAARSEHFWTIGKRFNDRRRELYQQMPGTTQEVSAIDSWDDVLAIAEDREWKNLRSCWWPVRLTAHGTVEVRTFDSTLEIAQIMAWQNAVRVIARG